MVEDAAIWLEKLENGLCAADGIHLREWLKDPLNRKAITERCQLCHGPEVMSVLAALFPVAEYLGPSHQSRALLMLSSVAAAVAIVTVATIGFMEGSSWLQTGRSRAIANSFIQKIYSTGMGERIKVPLPDGTEVALNSGTRIFVGYGARFREVYLVRSRTDFRSEAAFQVPRAGGRPFHVIVGPRVLEAADARFNVRQLTPETAEVTVLEGRVRVLSASLGTLEATSTYGNLSLPGEAIIGALETATVGPGVEIVSALDPTDVAQRFAWQRSIR